MSTTVATPGSFIGSSSGITAGGVGDVGGRIAGGALGGAIGGFFGGPIGAWIGRSIGSRYGGMAGRAAATAIASYMESADADADSKAREKEAAEPCVDCGEIRCFSPPEGADDELKEEFRRQLKEQEDTLNKMDPEELVKNIDKFQKQGRPKGDAAARRTTREDYRASRTRELETKYRREGRNDFAERAGREMQQEMAKLAATHTLDLVAGGDGSISGMGNSRVNSSLGSQWKGRRSQQLRDHAEKAKQQGKKMNAKLEECPPSGENPGSDASGNAGGDSGSGKGAGNSNVPVG